MINLECNGSRRRILSDNRQLYDGILGRLLGESTVAISKVLFDKKKKSSDYAVVFIGHNFSRNFDCCFTFLKSGIARIPQTRICETIGHRVDPCASAVLPRPTS